MKKISLILIFITLTSCASSSREKRQREKLLKSPQMEEVQTKDLNTYPEIYLNNESALQNVDTTEGIVEDAYFTGNDGSKIALSYNFALDFAKITDIQSFDFLFSSRFKDSYKMYWWNVRAQSLVAKHSAVSNDSISNPGARSDTDQSMTLIGLGIGHRFRALAGSMAERFFETVNVFGNYVTHIDSSDENKYQGYGYTADYTLHYRAGKSITYGVKFSYNWALVDRKKEDDDEKLPARSLTFGWSTLGLELGYYF